MSSEIEEMARKYGLSNAVQHGGKANPGPIIGMIIGKNPDLKPMMKEIGQTVARVVAEINAMSPEEQVRALEELAPELLVREKREKKMELGELEGAEGGVVMRLAPNPSGPLHIGHTRMAILNDEYVKRYGGKLIVRLEDTNPDTIMPEAYDMILKDLDYLEVEYHDVVNQSDRFDIYYDHARMLLEKGAAYICTCESEAWREMKDSMTPCEHRDSEPDDNLELFEKMLAGEFSVGEISMVVKTDISHPNPAVRDFVALRLLDIPHPLTGSDFIVYPLYNYSVAIDDYLMGMTHVLRGKDHLNNTIRQEYVYDHMGWKKPYFHHYGWVSIEDTVLSTRQIKVAIAEEKYTGWDDTRLGTVAALARRGIQPGAIRNYWLEVGIKGVDIKFAWENLFAYNKDIIDPVAHRYFFIWDPVVVRVSNADRLEGRVPLLPGNPDAGHRHTILEKEDDNFIYLNITSEDLAAMNPDDIIRLKDLGNFKLTGEKEFEY
ncbi:MAG: glutamate--tRNA ligase, partial [Thermoplasmata archaeon]|nr:glutamate--tRNA ligase [Thermoplasmata archaeon]